MWCTIGYPPPPPHLIYNRARHRVRQSMSGARGARRLLLSTPADSAGHAPRGRRVSMRLFGAFSITACGCEVDESCQLTARRKCNRWLLLPIKMPLIWRIFFFFFRCNFVYLRCRAKCAALRVPCCSGIRVRGISRQVYPLSSKS